MDLIPESHSCTDRPDVDKFIDLQSTKSHEADELSSAEDDEGDDESGSKRKGKRKQGRNTWREECKEDQVCFHTFSHFSTHSPLFLSLNLQTRSSGHLTPCKWI